MISTDQWRRAIGLYGGGRLSLNCYDRYRMCCERYHIEDDNIKVGGCLVCNPENLGTVVFNTYFFLAGKKKLLCLDFVTNNVFKKKQQLFHVLNFYGTYILCICYFNIFFSLVFWFIFYCNVNISKHIYGAAIINGCRTGANRGTEISVRAKKESYYPIYAWWYKNVPPNFSDLDDIR